MSDFYYLKLHPCAVAIPAWISKQDTKIQRYVKVPCQLCPLVVVVGLECFSDLWGYTVKPLMPDRSKVTFQTNKDTGVYAVCGYSRFASAHQTA